ncbi:hypothetical protein AQUCO_02900082v1 [Aquilegia coerulea]|uniref:Secreted protein n=1 Tax=Aquilegia coerulea TaxID=218851 RepID=A0A2G5D388_AQUCA|nr:hypothetical protein AQUCO_02900082v1 [Aquilegia coerulea]
MSRSFCRKTILLLHIQTVYMTATGRLYQIFSPILPPLCQFSKNCGTVTAPYINSTVSTTFPSRRSQMCLISYLEMKKKNGWQSISPGCKAHMSHVMHVPITILQLVLSL